MDRRVKERLVGASILVVLVVLIVPELLSGPKQAVNATGGAPDLHNVVVDMTTRKTTPAVDDPAALATTSDTADASNAANTSNTANATNTAGTAGLTDAADAPGAGRPSGEGTDTTARVEGVPGAAPGPPSIVTLQAQTPAKAPLENDPSPPRSANAGGNPADAQAQFAEAGRHAWSVQLGSFASRDNAEKLQRSLKAEGFVASVSPKGVGQGMRYRVRVGPAADRAGAEKLIARLRKEGHAATVVAP